MGLIINKQIRQLMKGYPTVSDKYNVAGGILAGNIDAHFGDLVKFSTDAGYYEVINGTNTITAKTEIAGLVLATNVKLAATYPGTSESVVTKPGEAFNLMLDGFVAVELKDQATYNAVSAGVIVKINTNGEFDTAGTLTIQAKYTGIKEIIDGKYFAEIQVVSFNF